MVASNIVEVGYRSGLFAANVSPQWLCDDLNTTLIQARQNRMLNSLTLPLRFAEYSSGNGLGNPPSWRRVDDNATGRPFFVSQCFAHGGQIIVEPGGNGEAIFPYFRNDRVILHGKP